MKRTRNLIMSTPVCSKRIHVLNLFENSLDFNFANPLNVSPNITYSILTLNNFLSDSFGKIGWTLKTGSKFKLSLRDRFISSKRELKRNSDLVNNDQS